MTFEEKIIKNLKEETNNLFNQVVNLENEKNTILQELNKARHFEDGTFLVKEKEYSNKLQSKDLIIKKIEQKTNSLYEQLDKKNERLSYRNDIINNSLNIIKESKNKIKELQLEIKKLIKIIFLKWIVLKMILKIEIILLMNKKKY